MDTESERSIQQSLESIKQGRTCIIIAHRLTTIEKADHIFVLEKGRLVDAGVHSRLIARDGVYARLYAGEKEAG